MDSTSEPEPAAGFEDEGAFQDHLDAHPDDWFARTVFADWLDENGDPRAEGYRAMGLWRLVPDVDYRVIYCYRPGLMFPLWANRAVGWLLPEDWYQPALRWNSDIRIVAHEPRRDQEDKVALAFARLPAGRRQELIAGAVNLYAAQ